MKGMVPAVARAVRLLDTLAVSKEPVTLASLSKELALPKSTVHGLCATLVHTGLVRRFENGAYHLGMHVVDWSYAFLARTEPTVEFAKISDLNLLPEETFILSVLDGADIVYVGCRKGTRPLGLNFRIGMRLPANCTATGKVLLSTLPPERIVEMERDGLLRRLTKHSVDDMPRLNKQLSHVRKHGYSVDEEETAEGMVCFGAPVFESGNTQAVAAVGVSLLKAVTDSHQKALAIEAVRKIATTLSERLGARSVPPPQIGRSSHTPVNKN